MGALTDGCVSECMHADGLELKDWRSGQTCD